MLNAVGTEAFPIVFAPATENNYQAGYWAGIVSNGEINLTYCKVKGAVTGLDVTKSPGAVAYSEFSKNTTGITLNYADQFTIDQCTITDNETGIQLLYSSPDVTNNMISNNTNYGLYAFRSKSKMTSNTFQSNGIYGLKISNKSMVSLIAMHPSNNPQVNNIFNINGDASVWIDRDNSPDFGKYLELNGQVYGGFNQFKNRGRNVDIFNDAEIVIANVNWWENMSIDGRGYVDTEPTADELFGPPAKIMASQSDSIPPSLEQAYIFELDDNYTDAITMYETVITDAPDGDYAVEALYGIIRCYSELEDFLSLDNTLLNYYSTYSNFPVGIASYDYSITVNTHLQQYDEALNRSIDLLDIVSGTDNEPHVLLEQGIIYSFIAADSTSPGQKQISPGSARQLAMETYQYVLNNYSESPSAEIAAWFLGETHVSSKPGELEAPIPQTFALHQNYPNPFNATTTIRYDIPERSIVSIKIYDILGREVATLVHNTMSAGFHELRWDGKDIQGIPVSTGMYIYKFTANSKVSKKQFVKNQKMVMMK
ncbi:MAG: T9SS type A sorting domain-containing protein [Planctomycetia bacterium]|nr:T9SS type A sorting domain-containing protein [Planctomycetia bacterium]